MIPGDCQFWAFAVNGVVFDPTVNYKESSTHPHYSNLLECGYLVIICSKNDAPFVLILIILGVALVVNRNKTVNPPQEERKSFNLPKNFRTVLPLFPGVVAFIFEVHRLSRFALRKRKRVPPRENSTSSSAGASVTPSSFILDLLY